MSIYMIRFLTLILLAALTQIDSHPSFAQESKQAGDPIVIQVIQLEHLANIRFFSRPAHARYGGAMRQSLTGIPDFKLQIPNPVGYLTKGFQNAE